MNLTETPDTITWPDTIYCYVEGIGPFQQTAPAAWKDFMAMLPKLQEQAKVAHRYFARYRGAESIYRAGVELKEPAMKLPDPLKVESFKGGKYARFTLTGPYALLPEASGRVFQRIKDLKLDVRDDFNIEHYANDPKTTPEAQLITEILIPVR